jgi:streptogramin lyase
MRHVARAVVALSLLALPAVLDAEPDSGSVQNLAGTGEKGFSGDGGPATAAKLDDPCGIVVGPDGAVYVCDTANHAIRRIAADGTISTVAGTGGAKGYSGDGGPATKAMLNEPYEVRFDKSGNLFLVERLNHTVRRVDGKTGVIATVAGTGKRGFSGDGGPATKAELNDPHSIQFGPDGALYIADVLNHRVRRVDMTTGVITTFAGTGEKKPPKDGASLDGAPLHGPRALDVGPDGNLYLALREGNSIWRIDLKSRTLHHLAGTGKKGFTGHGGPAKDATLSGPKGVAVAADGTVYFADTESHSIRAVDPKTNTIHLIVGTGEKGDGPASGPADACQLNRPHGVAIAPDGALLIGDSQNHGVRRVPLKP